MKNTKVKYLFGLKSVGEFKYNISLITTIFITLNTISLKFCIQATNKKYFEMHIFHLIECEDLRTLELEKYIYELFGNTINELLLCKYVNGMASVSDKNIGSLWFLVGCPSVRDRYKTTHYSTRIAHG